MKQSFKKYGCFCVVIIFAIFHRKTYLMAKSTTDQNGVNLPSPCRGNLSVSEYDALENFYLATSGPNWRTFSTDKQWVFPSSFSSPCDDQWQGITCRSIVRSDKEEAKCTVNSLILPFANLQGTIPSSIAAFSFLNVLQLSFNSLYGSIPPQLGNLLSLMDLEMFENRITGHIPFELSNLTSLGILYLYANSLTGSIPPQLGNLLALTHLVLNDNNLSGSIPPQLGNLSELVELNLSNTSLTGPIPPELGRLSALEQFYVHQNFLTGSLPSELGNLSHMAEFVPYGNFLTGCIPSQLSNILNLEVIAAYDNLFTSTIPSQLGNLFNLTQLYLNGNSLTGPMPPTLGKLSSLSELSLYYNCLTGSIPTQLAYLSELTELCVDVNSLSGNLPTVLGQLSKLSFLATYGNLLTGSIPDQMGQLSDLMLAYMDVNYFTGRLPTQIGDLSKIKQLYLEENFLYGVLPSSWDRLYENMTTLSLSSNDLTGTIPSALSSMKQSYELNLSTNAFTGTVPSVLGEIGSDYIKNGTGINFIGVVIDLSKNSLTGTIPPELFTAQMQTISLFSNCFHGSIPSAICSASNVRSLIMDLLTSGEGCGKIVLAEFKGTFATHLMEGTVPSCVWSLSELRTLHLSGNGLQGTIGEIDTTALKLADLDLSNNYLTGTLPLSLQSYIGMRQLALSNNKFSGTLSESFYTGNMTLLTLSVNRLSGDLPSAIASVPRSVSVDVLSGNLFACGTALPTNDTASTSYVCGSSTLDASLYVWIACFLLQLLVLVVAWRGSAGVNSGMGEYLGQGFHWWTHFNDYVIAASACGAFVETSESCRMIFLFLGVLYVCLCIPIYVILKTVGNVGTLTDQYSWVTTVTYLHGYLPVIFLVAFVSMSVVRLAAQVRHIQRFSVHKSFQPQPQTRVVWCCALQRLLLQLISVVVVLTVNVGYVYVLLSNHLPVTQVVLLQVAMGSFKLLWKYLYINRASVTLFRKYEDITGGTAVFHEVAMNVFNFVLAPYVATLGTDSNCLYNALVGTEPIISKFNISAFDTEVVTGDLRTTLLVPIPYQLQTVISVAPPWLYSGQCVSALLTNYVPVLTFTFATSGIVTPLVKYLILAARSKFRDANADTEFTFSLRRATVTAEKMFDSRSIMMDMLVDVAILMTFGLASPLLALAITLKQVNNGVYLRLWVGRYLLQAESLPMALAQLDEASKFIQGKVRAISVFLIFVVSTFWSGMVFDMIADVYGSVTGAIVAALSVVLWCISGWVANTLSTLWRRGRAPSRSVGSGGPALTESLIDRTSNVALWDQERNAVFQNDRGSDVELFSQQHRHRQSFRDGRVTSVI